MIDSLFTPVIVILTLTYIYFWLVALHARRHDHIDTSAVTNREIAGLLRRTRHSTDPRRFTIQITTRGGSVPVVCRGIEYVIKAVRKYPVLRRIVKVEVITESLEDKAALDAEFGQALIPVTVYVLPADYQTPRGTQLKARALHYMVELHRQNPSNSYVVHYDEESVFTEDNLARLVRNLLRTPIGISEGSISYPLEYQDAELMCRTMEANRPFGCHECFLVMSDGLPVHLHGSNLVIQERLENEIGWDIGKLDGNPLIAEDLVFGLMAYQKYGKDAFGWHHVEMIEQPPFTIEQAYKQRERWVMGALQGVAHVRTLPGWAKLSRTDRLKIRTVIPLRVATYALGLPVSILSILTWSFYLGYHAMNWALGNAVSTEFSLLGLPGLALWLGGNQIGLWQNLRYTAMTRREKAVEHLKVLATTPFSGIFDTAGPAVASTKWLCGIKTVGWTPTIKIKGQREYGVAEVKI